MLEIVGHPVAVNPDRELARLARQQEWEIREFDQPVRLRRRVPDPGARPRRPPWAGYWPPSASASPATAGPRTAKSPGWPSGTGAEGGCCKRDCRRWGSGGHLLLGDDGAEGEHDHEQHELLHPDLLPGSEVTGDSNLLTQHVEVNGRLVGPLVFKTSGTGDPRPVGSIPATSANVERPPRQGGRSERQPFEGCVELRRRAGRGRRCRRTGDAASTSPGPRSGGSAPG